jgi:hypothetical protein
MAQGEVATRMDCRSAAAVAVLDTLSRSSKSTNAIAG